MGKAKYLLQATVGTTAGSTPVTITRLSDGNQIPFINAPLIIDDIYLVSSPTSQGVLRIFRDGQNVYVTPAYNVMLTSNPSRPVIKVAVSGSAQNQISFDVFVITPLSTGSETLKFVVEVAE